MSELQFDIQSWAEVLVREVPEQRLEECYLRAMREHSKLPAESRRFPLVATEIAGAMYLIEREILAEELNKQRCVYCVAHRKDRALPDCPFHPRGSLPL